MQNNANDWLWYMSKKNETKRLWVFISSAYSGDDPAVVEDNIRYGKWLADRVADRGYHAWCPHMLPMVLQETYGYEVMMEICLAVLAKCDYVLSGRVTKGGSLVEQRKADTLKKPIYTHWEDLPDPTNLRDLSDARNK